METIEHFANISLVARLLGGERMLSREEVVRLQGLRGHYGITAPAPICPEPANRRRAAECQVVQAPTAAGERLVPHCAATPDDLAGVVARRSSAPGSGDADQEIRLTYRQLAALIEDAVKNLK